MWTEREERSEERGVRDNAGDWRAGEHLGRERSQYYSQGHEQEEDDINFVELGQTGDLVLTAVPNTRLSFRVVKITPVSFPEEGKNYFNVEAELVDSSARLRPGMEGYGKIEVERRKLIWIWPRRFVNWLRLTLWSWTP